MEQSMGARLRLSIEIDRELREALARWADDEGRPLGNLLRRIVALSVAQREEQARPGAQAHARKS
jgi:hypothetical protein